MSVLKLCCLLPAALRRKSLDHDNDPIMEEVPSRRSFAAAPAVKRTSGAFPAAAARLRQSLDRSRSSLDARRDSLQVTWKGKVQPRPVVAFTDMHRMVCCGTRSAFVCIHSPVQTACVQWMLCSFSHARQKVLLRRFHLGGKIAPAATLFSLS